jgi:hypothetical protein
MLPDLPEAPRQSASVPTRVPKAFAVFRQDDATELLLFFFLIAIFLLLIRV